jgi:superfamily II DNA or RNA helicase
MGILSILHFKKIDFEGSGPGTRISRGDRKAQPSRQLAYHPGRFRSIVETVSTLPLGERAIVFAASIEHGAAIAAAVTDRGRPAALVSGYQDPKARRRTLDAFERGELAVLVNKAILIAGYDCPAVKHVLLTVPVRSAVAFEQMVGRGSRGPKVGGNRESFVWQLDDMLALHGAPSSYSRYRDQSWLEQV